MDNISFIIGSGFSEPAGFPTASKINERLRQIHATEICKDTGGGAFFLNSDTDPNSHWMGVKERNFIQEFIEFYIAKGAEFHYECFYDYYHEYLINNNYPEDLTAFFTRFR